jgi:hypothetical protein
MSDFPSPDNYKTANSNGLLKHLFNPCPFNIIIKREKMQYIYDIDNNKYTDFFLNNGTVIYGHNYGTLTKFIKNALSAGSESLFLNKFQYRTFRTVKEATDKNNDIRFYNTENIALIALINMLNPSSIAVNTSRIKNIIKALFPSLSITEKKADIAILEPIEFDNRLEDTDFKVYDTKTKISYESRTAFRLKYGFIKNLDEVNYIIAGANLSNGLDCGVIVGKRDTLPVGENIPSYKATAINETLKLYKRKMDYPSFGEIIPQNIVKAKRGSIFKLKSSYKAETLLPYGIILDGDTGYITPYHTERDFHRLKQAIS